MTTFKEIYEQAKLYRLDDEEWKHRPMNPEVRYYGRDSGWKLESGLYSAEDVEALCDLEVFDQYFWETYSEIGYSPSDADESEFLKMISEND